MPFSQDVNKYLMSPECVCVCVCVCEVLAQKSFTPQTIYI